MIVFSRISKTGNILLCYNFNYFAAGAYFIFHNASPFKGDEDVISPQQEVPGVARSPWCGSEQTAELDMTVSPAYVQ